MEGLTVGATNDSTGPCGTASTQNSPGVWYRFRGNGRTVEASTCHGDPFIGGNTFDTVIKVYSGSCGSLQCIAGNDDDPNDNCSFASGVRWYAGRGGTYYILVHGFSGEQGRFGLVVR